CQLDVVAHMFRIIAPHAGEEAHIVFVEIADSSFAVIRDLVAAGFIIGLVNGGAVFKGFLLVQFCVEGLSVDHGPVAVLFPVVVGQQAQGVFRVVFVNGGVGI